jgi:hypothetical protein
MAESVEQKRKAAVEKIVRALDDLQDIIVECRRILKG